MTQRDSQLPATVPAKLPPILARREVSWAATASFAFGSAALILAGSHFWTWLLVLGGLAFTVTSWISHLSQSSPQASAAAPENELKRQLSKSRYLEGVEDLADQATTQFQSLSQRFHDFQAILAQKFNPGELTYDRYLGAANEVHLAVLDRLQKVSELLKSIHAIRPKELEERIHALTASSGAGAEELPALQSRLELATRQLTQVKSLLAFNEKAITDLDLITQAISEIKTSNQRTQTDLDSAMSQLEELARRAKQYSV